MSLVYSHILAYRAAMSVLYLGGYRARFARILDHLGSARSVCELCFGDTQIAEGCRERGVRWTGIDINPGFVRRARRLGFEATRSDVLTNPLPPADCYIMAASLYHFHAHLAPLFDDIFARTDRWLLSEPVRNLSSVPGPLGWLARRSANPGNSPAPFRFDADTLTAAVTAQTARLGLRWSVLSVGRDMLLEIVRP